MVSRAPGNHVICEECCGSGIECSISDGCVAGLNLVERTVF